MGDRGAELGFDVVADDRQVAGLETLGESLIAGDEHRHVVDEADPGFQRAFGIEAGRLLRPDRHVVQQDFRTAALQLGDDLFLGRFLRVGTDERPIVGEIRHMLGDAVQHLPHAHDHAAVGDVLLEDLRAVGLREDGPMTSVPTLRASTSKAATTSISHGR
jgi:hypothetical protein